MKYAAGYVSVKEMYPVFSLKNEKILDCMSGIHFKIVA